MYNWKSCKLNGEKINSLFLNGYLIWQKQIDSNFDIFYCTLSDDFDVALSQFSQLNTTSMDNLDYSQKIEFNSIGAGRPVVLTKGGINSVTIQFWVGDPVNKWFPAKLSKGIVSIEDESQYDVSPQVTINGVQYTVWTPDGDIFDYTIPKGAKCELIIA